jgi:DNA-binding NarL/FixJ family response regulator
VRQYDSSLKPKMRAALQQAAAEVKDAEERRNQLIAEAWQQGGSLREIGEEVGLTHTGISKLLERMGVRRRISPEEANRLRGRLHG